MFCGALVVAGNNDDSCASGLGNNYASEVTIPVTMGTVYYIEWDDRYVSGANAFNWSLVLQTCTPPAATLTAVDDCANTQFSVDVDVTSLGDAATVSISNDGGVTATTGIATIGIVTVGPFAAGTPVNITLEHDGDADCNVAIGSISDSCPPSNDECAGAITINCDDVLFGATNTGATDSGVGNAANDLWYAYSGAAGDITVTTCAATGYDTNLLVFSDCGTTLVTENDDSGCAGFRSTVTFTADGTSTYYIVVDGYNTSSGSFQLAATCDITITPPANDLCANAEGLTIGGSVSGTTAGALEENTNEKPGCDPFGTIADVWYSVTLPASTNTLTVTTTVSGASTEANAAIYTNDCVILDANILACGDDGGLAGEVLVITGTAGTTYLVRIWSDGLTARNSQRVEGTFDVIADATLSTEDINANGLAFTYYPNPVSSALTLKAQKDIENVSVYNMLGQEVFTTTPNAVNTEVNMSALQSGAYFVKVTIGNAIETVRVLKN